MSNFGIIWNLSVLDFPSLLWPKSLKIEICITDFTWLLIWVSNFIFKPGVRLDTEGVSEYIIVNRLFGHRKNQ